MARFLDSTSSIKKEAGKKKKKQETTQKQTTQSPSYSQKVQQTNQRLTQKYGGGSSGGSARTTTSRTNPDQRTTQAQNQKMYGQPTQPVRRNQAELQRQKEERRSRAQEQKSGNFERPISRAQYADKRRATSFREKYTRWDNDIADTVGHTLKQTVAEDKRYLNRAAKGITMKDRHQWATPEQIRKADERTERRDRKYASQIEKEGQELEKLKQGHSYLGQQALSATSSATGMAADLAVGALTGTGEAGSLGHMFMRSTGGAYGQVKKKAASLRKQLEASGNYTPDELDEMFKDVNKRDELNAMASGGIEVLSELMFRGFGPAAKYVGKGGGIAERAAGKLFKKAGGRATSGIVKNALRGTAEEVAEEEIGGPLQALAANTIYGNKYQKYSEDAVKRDFKAQSDELRSQIHSDEDAQMVTARLNSDAFMNDSIKAYMDSGMSEDEARQMAEMSREYLTASLSGDIDKMSEMQNKLVDKLAGGENTLKEKFTLRDAVDAAVSTSMMTLTTGVPGAISTAQAGRAYKGTQGLEGVRNLAEVVRNWDTEESAKAQKIIDAIDNGSDVSDTQVYELIQKAGSAAEAQSEAETTKDQIAQKGMEKYDLRVAPAVRDEYGDVTLSENTQQRYDKIVNDTVSRYDSLAKLGESEKFEKAHVKQGASLAAAQMTGVITAEDVHDLVKADPEVKAVFQDVTGIALDQFTEYDKNGNIDVAATNNSMMNALMAEAATNYINSARLEQAAWANDVRGEMLQTMSDNLNSKGDEALFDALQNIDPRDRDTFMLTGMASQYVYEHGWSTQDTWEEAKGDLQRMFPSLSVDSLQGVYEAAKEDRIESETPFLNAQVVKDEALTELAKSGQKAEVRGKFKNRTKRVLNAEETVICASLAKQFNANITMVGEKNKNLSYIDENGEEKFSNAAVVLSKGEIYISKKADISKIIHEVTHMGAKLASTQYLDMAHYIMDKAYKHSPERTRMLVEAYKRTYQGQNLTDAQIEEEVVADIVTAFEHDRVFLREIAQEEPSLFRRIYNAICDVIRTLRNILSTGRVLDPELQETFLAEIGAYEETRRMWLDMMHEAARNNAIVGLAKWENNAYKDSRESRDIKRTDNMNPTENEDVRFSITPQQQETIEHNVGPDVRFSVPTWRETLAKAIFNSSEGFSAYSGKQSGRQKTYELTKNNFSEEQAKAVTDYMDMMAAWFEKTGEGSIRAKYKFIGWDDLTKAEVQVRKNDKGEIVSLTVSAMVKNGEYPVNFDLTTVCNKREGFSEVIKNLIDTKVPGTNENVLNTIKLTDKNMWKINQALKAEGIDTACLGCFVEARRYYAQNFMNKIDDKWNNAVRKARRELGLPEEEYFNFANGKEVSGEEWSAIDDLWSAYDESKESKSSPADRIKILMDEIIKNKETDSPYLKLIQMSDISTPEGYNAFKQLSTKGHDMVKTIKSIYGTSAPKEILAFTPYNSEIALLPENMKGMPTGDYLRSIGGIRVQSFSDFKIEHVFDHFQMVADEAARKFVTHGYSKVIAFPRIFGLTGRKINMSVMFDVLPNRAWSQVLGIPVRKAAKYAKKYQGLQFVKEKPENNPDNRPYIETEIEGVHGYLTYLVSDADYVNSVRDREYRKNLDAGMSEDEARRKANEAKPFEQSINYKDAVELENQEGYKENIGIIAVAYGDEHLKVLMSDPNVRYIIPYHKSGLPTFISKKTSLAIARDYTNFQNTNIAESWKDANGKEVDFRKEFNKFVKEHKDEKYPAIEFFKQINDNKYKVKFGSKTASQKSEMAGTADFDVYKDIDSVKDIREVSNAYLEHCIKNGWCPVFHEFAGDPNYYKMIFDFAVTDGTTTHIYPQRAVRNNYPGLDIDAKVAAGEEITEADLAGLKEAIEKGAKEQNDKNMIRANNMGNVMNDLLSKDTENSIIADTNLQSIRWGTPDYTDVKLGNEEMTPEETDADVRLSISANLDDDYMDAYFDGDDDAMQDLVDMAAERAGYKYKAYHHTENAFTVFDRSKARRTMDIQGFYFSADPEAEREYGSVRYDVFLKINNPYVVDSSDKMNALPFEYGTEDAGVKAREWLQENGYDAVIRDAEYYGAEADEIIVFEPEQIKSSEPMLFEDDPNGEYGEGDIIPLSQRFDPTNPDIRYSLPTQDSDGNILTDGQMEYFKNSQARDVQGRLVRVFHSTDKGGFTVFGPMESNDQRSLFFTSLRRMSESYIRTGQKGDINPYEENAVIRSIKNVDGLPEFISDEVTKRARDNISNIRVIDNDGGEVIAEGDDFVEVAKSIVQHLEQKGIDAEEDLMILPDILYDDSNPAQMGEAWEVYNELRSIDGFYSYTMDYADYGDAGTYTCYLNLEKPLVIDARGHYWNDIPFDERRGYYKTRELAELAQNEGFDGVIIRNVVDYGSSGYGNDPADVYIAFSSNQVKDTRNENPSDNPDIRYSKVDPDEAMSRAAHDYAYDTSHEMLLYYEDIINNLQDKDAASAYKKAQKFAEKDVDKFYAGLQWYSDGIKFDDAVLEEGRERMASSKADFFASNEARWNERWLTEGRVLEARSVRSPIRKLVMSVMQNSDTNSKYKTDLVNKTIVDARMAYYYAKQGRTDIADAMLWHSALRMIEGVDFIDDTVFKSYKDLRDYLRTTNISLNEEYWADIDYQAFRKRNYNKINLVSGETNVDQIYQEMCELWPEWFKEDEEMTPPDQLARIEQVLDAIQPYRIAYSSEEAAEMAFDIASDLTRIIRDDGKEYKSIADRYKEKYDQKTKALKERHQEALREANEKQKDLEKKAKAQFKEYKAEQREKKYHDKYFDSIKGSYDELVKRLRTNTKDKHIPEQYKRELAALLSAFDFQTVRSKKMEVKKGKDGYERLDLSQKTIQLRQLQGILKGIEQNTQFFRVNDSITDLMDSLLGIELGKYSEAMNVEGKTIDELNSEQLKRLDKMLKSLIHEFNNYENVRVGEKKQKAADIGSKQIESSLAHAAKYGPGKDFHNFVGALDRIINMDEMTPAYLFKQIDAEGDGIGTMFGELRRSFDKYVRNQAQLNEWIGEIVGKYHEKGLLWNKYGSGELSKWRSVNYQKEFMLENGKSVKLTPAQMMSIHCLAKRTQAKNHMTGAGIVAKPVAFEAKLMSDLKQKANYALPVALSDSDIRMIENELTPEQTEVADKLQELMATKMAEWGNEASMSVIGIRLFEDKDYFPIKSDRAALEKDFTAEQFNDMIRNFGFTKAVAPGAKNAIAVDDIFDVVAEHCNNMNLYNAYTESLNDFTKVYNYHQLGPENSDYSVEQAIAHAYSQKATTFIRTFIQDLNGNVSRGRTSGLNDIMNDMLGKAKKASVFANGRVALQQPTALFRAFAVIDPKYIKGAKAPTKANLQEMFDHCPIALWKSWGYYDINMGKSVEDLMMNNGSWAEDTMSDIYGKLDNATWCVLWNMCKAEVKEKNPDVKEGTEEYWELCNKRMTEVVDLTQVVDSPFHRSHAMRSKDILHKMSTAFMAEPTLTFNMVRDGIKRAHEAYADKDYAKASKILGRTASVFVIQAAAVAGAAAIWDVIRDKGQGNGDDDDLSVFDLWWMDAVENFKDNLNLFSNVYYVKDIVSLFQGWDQKNLGLQGFVHLRDAWFQLSGTKKSYSKLTWYQNALAGIGYLTGTPYKTIMNDGKAILNILGIHPGILDSFDSQLTNFQSAVQDLMGGEAAANGFTKTSSDGGSKTTDDRREAKAEDKSEGNGLPTAVRGWTYDDAPFHVEDGSLADKFLNHFGVNLTAAEISAIEEAEAEKKLKAKIDDIKAKTESLSGEEKDKKVWSYVQSYMKAENGDKSWSELVAEGDYASIGSIEAMYVRAGGNSEYFDGRIMAESKSALKKSISSDNTPEQIQAQAQIRDYLLNNGMEPAEVSEIAYKSYTARDLKVAFRINDKEAMLTELRALVQAGLTEEDYQKLWDNRNRLDIKKYKESGGKYADRLKSTGVYNWPINGSITSRFGHRSSPGGVGSTNHQGLDIAGSMGDPVGASDGGTVVYAGWYGGAGKTVMIEHDDGTVTQYSHLSWYDAQPGDIVAQGQYIGKVGSTGNSTGPHLHFGVKVNGVYQDPETYLANR